ncbi:MAG TPA: FAD-dependent oxidoreductase [Rhizomicrobium sp.]|nr:FAD-dependent oxidoreductase [Rhizomicrobium sp.]
MGLSRRDVLGGTAAFSLTPFLGRTPRAAELDVAIIGGGVAGAYAAWRLAGTSARVRLFECSGRIGGRLRSIAFPQAPHLIGEAGGMRFLEAQRHVWKLVNHLKLEKRSYPIELPQDRLALRGVNIALGERDKKLFPYNMPSSEQDPKSDIFMRGLARAVPDAATMNPVKWRAQRLGYRFQGRALKDWSTWAMMAEIFTAEEIHFFQDSGGYDDFDLYGSSLGFFDYIFLGEDESKPFSTLVDGYQQLPLTLARGAAISLNERLTSITLPEPASGAFRLAFSGSHGKQATITAKRVVLALPQRAINLIPDFPARTRFKRLIDSVVAVGACKAFLLYPKPWWHDAGVDAGRSITDMPARQFYVYGSESARAAFTTNGYGLLMMYCDATMVEYWKQLARPANSNTQGFSWLGGATQLAHEIDREAALVFNCKTPAPLAAAFQDWTIDPFGGAWHYWDRGADGIADGDAMLKPLSDCELYVCGEAWSQDQGWAEGALERSETMLQKHFGLRAPDWLK